MPIATPKLYKCPKCGYETIVYQGDVLTPSDLNQICPKCKTKMELCGVSKGIFDILKDVFCSKKS